MQKNFRGLIIFGGYCEASRKETFTTLKSVFNDWITTMIGDSRSSDIADFGSKIGFFF